VPVEELEGGMVVWTQDADGAWRILPILRTSQTPVRNDHQVVFLRLSDGREISASPGMLRPGDDLDGAKVTRADLVPYDGEFTYDILPAGDTGNYRAGGIPLKSTLA
jgi:hypothetical protein